MKPFVAALFALFLVYVMIQLKIIPYQLVSNDTMEAMQDKIDKLSAATPPPPPTPSPTPAPTVVAPLKGNQLIAAYNGALLLVEGQKGVGTGFLCNMDGHTYAITNAHVLSDNVGVKLTSLSGATFTAGASAVATGHDIVKMQVADTAKVFEVMPSPDINAKVGDDVIVLGNAEGGGVVRPMEGKLLGIGPDLIEVDTQFEKGDSGSPIIHAATGKVIGIATYLVDRKVTPAGVTLGARRFGYRLDTVRTWEPINWQAFFLEASQVAEIRKLSQDFIAMSTQLTNKTLMPESYASPRLRQVITTYQQDSGRAGLSVNDKINFAHNLIAELRSDTHTDIDAFNARPSYDYFHREVEDEGLFRDKLYEALTRALNTLH